jgi:hypothetical protein
MGFAVLDSGGKLKVTNGPISLSSTGPTGVTGVLPVANGGTNVTNFDYCRITNSSAQLSVPTATIVDVTFDTEVFDTNAMHDPNPSGDGPERITVKRNGTYLVCGGVFWATGATGTTNQLLLVRFMTNATVVEGSRSYFPIIADFALRGQGQSTSAIIAMAANDFVKMQVYQETITGAHSTLALQLENCSLQVAYLGP